MLFILYFYFLLKKTKIFPTKSTHLQNYRIVATPTNISMIWAPPTAIAHLWATTQPPTSIGTQVNNANFIARPSAKVVGWSTTASDLCAAISGNPSLASTSPHLIYRSQAPNRNNTSMKNTLILSLKVAHTTLTQHEGNMIWNYLGILIFNWESKY